MLEEIVPRRVGKPERWFTKEKLRSKFDDCCRGIIDVAQASEIYELAQSIEQVADLSALTNAVGRRSELVDTSPR